MSVWEVVSNGVLSWVWHYSVFSLLTWMINCRFQEWLLWERVQEHPRAGLRIQNKLDKLWHCAKINKVKFNTGKYQAFFSRRNQCKQIWNWSDWPVLQEGVWGPLKITNRLWINNAILLPKNPANLIWGCTRQSLLHTHAPRGNYFSLPGRRKASVGVEGIQCQANMY